MKEKKEIEIVQGDGKGLNISPVENHINDLVNKKKKIDKNNIVIPKIKEKKDSKSKKTKKNIDKNKKD